MTGNEWQRKIVWAVGRAANGRPEYLAEIANRLADSDVATESLMLAGFGDEDEGLLDMTVKIVEKVQNDQSLKNSDGRGFHGDDAGIAADAS